MDVEGGADDGVRRANGHGKVRWKRRWDLDCAHPFLDNPPGDGSWIEASEERGSEEGRILPRRRARHHERGRGLTSISAGGGGEGGTA